MQTAVVNSDSAIHLDPDGEAFFSEDQLAQLTVADIPHGAVLRMGQTDGQGVIRVEWEGCIAVSESGYAQLLIETELWPKFWYGSLGARHHLDLLHRSVLARERTVGDVKIAEYETSDDVCIRLTYRVDPPAAGSALDWVQHSRRVQGEIERPVKAVSDELDRALGRAAHSIATNEFASLTDLLALVDASVDAASKGRSLEVLIAAAVQQVPGFTVLDRNCRTATEEIDLTVLNGSDDALLKKEKALVLVECKNWSGNVPRLEVSALEGKIRNRYGRCSLAYIVVWSDLTHDARQELLRQSRGDFVIVPITGTEVRAAILAGPLTVADLFRDSFLKQVRT